MMPWCFAVEGGRGEGDGLVGTGGMGGNHHQQRKGGGLFKIRLTICYAFLPPHPHRSQLSSKVIHFLNSNTLLARVFSIPVCSSRLDTPWSNT